MADVSRGGGKGGCGGRGAAPGGTLQGQHMRGQYLQIFGIFIVMYCHKFMFNFKFLTYSEEEEASMQ